MEVAGDIAVGADCVSFDSAAAYIYLEDVGRPDEAAQCIGFAKLDAVCHRQGAQQLLPFVVAASDVPVSGEVAVRVHISLNGRADVAVFDLVSETAVVADPFRPVRVAVGMV